ncbi:acyl carrier protein phosphodiesterase [Runella defluvii]|uniref:Acyl carrier protein phosphodiesterase n=1 Tax=Runella defluvii TaxID=370973 RepID=A0A7W5ZI47_9BACT|nr:acyl carrier protein phosphodiesterase [Runella defluvii]MBB3837712.1 acyl carrier protein phosphodiesterase [Runella defluvii]
MNYLAHFYLSFGQKPLVVGNLLGDFVRGRLDHPRNAHYTTPIRQGILLHRHIDSFTDAHPVGLACRQALPSSFGKYRGVVMDMYFDYFLAKHFNDYHAQPLPDFVAEVYQTLEANRAILPADALLLVDSMIKYDWLYHYQFIEGMNRSFQGMSRRFAFLKGIEHAGAELAEKESQYESYFRSFFPDLVSSCEDFLI